MSTPPNNNGHLPPHSVEAEEAVLGAILIDPDTVYTVSDFLKPSHFYIVKNGWIYETLLALAETDGGIDYVTVADHLRERGKLDEIGGAAYLTQLINHTPTSFYAESYAQIIERTALRRGLLSAASDLAKLAHDEEHDIHEVLDQAGALLAGVADVTRPDETTTANDAAWEDYDQVEALRIAGKTVSGVASGYHELDHLTGGFAAGWYITVAGRPGSGKTALAMSIAKNRLDQGDVIGLVSAEMSRTELIQRFKSMESGVSTTRIRTGHMDDAEWLKYTDATVKVGNWPLHIYTPRESLTPLKLRNFVRKMKRAGAALVIVDYLQLMEGGRKFENRALEVAYISRQIKLLTQEFKLPIIVAAQLNREVENRADKRPLLSDLKESGAIEQDSDLVMFIYRDEMYNENTQRPNQADLLISKFRHGPTGTVTLFFRKELTLFANLRKMDLDLAKYDGGPLSYGDNGGNHD